MFNNLRTKGVVFPAEKKFIDWPLEEEQNAIKV